MAISPRSRSFAPDRPRPFAREDSKGLDGEFYSSRCSLFAILCTLASRASPFLSDGFPHQAQDQATRWQSGKKGGDSVRLYSSESLATEASLQAVACER